MSSTPAVAAACAEQRLCYSSPYNFDFAGLEGLESLKVDNIKPQKIASSSPMATVPYSGTSSFHHRDESWVCRPAQSTSCRRSSMRKWRNCTSRHSTVLTQKQAVYIGFKVEGPFFGVHYRYQDARFIRGCCRGQRFRCLGELFAYRARVRDDPGMRARSRRTFWNRARLRRTVCDRARLGLAVSTGTKKVSQIVSNFTVSLGSSQGTNPRTGGHSKRKRPLSEVFA